MMKTSEKVCKMRDRSLTISFEISVKETIKKKYCCKLPGSADAATMNQHPSDHLPFILHGALVGAGSPWPSDATNDV